MSPRTGRPIIGNKKEVELKLRIDKETDEALKRMAKEIGTTKSALVRQALNRFLQKKEEP